MPTYEYLCRDCGHGFDIVQSFKDESLTICPACGGVLRKVFAAPAISFKGSGFYATDSRKGSKSSESKHDGAKQESAKSDTSKGDKGEGSKEASSKETSSSSTSSSSDGGSSKPKETSSTPAKETKGT
jgi:putative FmdB family regulatory protein